MTCALQRCHIALPLECLDKQLPALVVGVGSISEGTSQTRANSCLWGHSPSTGTRLRFPAPSGRGLPKDALQPCRQPPGACMIAFDLLTSLQCDCIYISLLLAYNIGCTPLILLADRAIALCQGHAWHGGFGAAMLHFGPPAAASIERLSQLAPGMAAGSAGAAAGSSTAQHRAILIAALREGFVHPR